MRELSVATTTFGMKKACRIFAQRFAVVVLSVFALLMAVPAKAQISFDQTATAEAMAQAALGNGFQYVPGSATLIGAADQSAIFSQGLSTPGLVDADNGLMFITGRVNTFWDGTTTNRFIDVQRGTAGDADLTALAGLQTFDAAGIRFQFTALGNGTVNIPVTFLTEEYPEYYGSTFNDVVGVYLDGGLVGSLNVNSLANPPSPPTGFNNGNTGA